MKAIISGLINTETNVAVREFPIPYFPIDYPFFGVNTSVGGVGYNISKALKTLGDDVSLYSFTGNDLTGDMIIKELENDQIATDKISRTLKATPQSVVLHAPDGRREIYCDLKDIQDTSFHPSPSFMDEIQKADVFILCNINFNRSMIPKLKECGVRIATDVHVLSQTEDEYNRDFLENADIVFLSDEGIKGYEHEFLRKLASRFPASVIVMGRGEKGVTYYERSTDHLTDLPACQTTDIVNTIGAGDALFSSFLHFYVQGLSVSDSLKRAQKFASIKIGFDGAANGFVTEKELESLL